MCKLDQIRIVQDGSEIFAVDTITWPNDTFRYPIVYTAVSMNRDSYDAEKVGWKWITREQYEWLIQHYKCMVGCIQIGSSYIFHCHNHQTFEKGGKDWPKFPGVEPEPPYSPDRDYNYEREV